MEKENFDATYSSSCGRFTTIHFIEYLWQRLPATEAEQIDQHILTCAACLAHLNYWSVMTNSVRTISPVLVNNFTPLWEEELGRLKHRVLNDIPYWLLARPLLNLPTAEVKTDNTPSSLPDGWLDEVIKVQEIIQQRQQQHLANSCPRWSENQLIKFCLQELDPLQVTEFTEHLKACVQCQKQFHQLLNVMPTTPTPQVWAAIKTELTTAAENPKSPQEWPKQEVTTMLIKSMFVGLGETPSLLPTTAMPGPARNTANWSDDPEQWNTAGTLWKRLRKLVLTLLGLS